MDTTFTKDFFAGNRARLRQLFSGTAPIVLTANGLLQRNGDMTFKFRQDSNFWYLTGVEYPDVVLVMDKGKEYLIVPTRDQVLETFEGRINVEELIRVSGIDTVLDEKTGWKRLNSRLKRSKHVAIMAAPAPYLDFYNFYTNPARAALTKKLKDANESIELLDLRDHFVKLRSIKQPPELVAIRRAVDLTVDVLRYVTKRPRFTKYAYEYEIEADISRQFRLAEAGHAFDPIVAGGARACQMHYVDNNGPLSADELLIFDVGAEVGLYAADIARTVAVGQPSRRQETVISAVCEVQDYAYSLIKPGMVNVDYEKQVELFMGEKLRELGVIKTIDKESVRRHFPHMTTHFMGLEAHDVGNYQQPMQPGMVMVVEPGIYIPEEGIGVRIEDDILITEDGHEVLSSGLPRLL